MIFSYQSYVGQHFFLLIQNKVVQRPYAIKSRLHYLV